MSKLTLIAVISALLLLAAPKANAEDHILTCVEDKSASIVWNVGKAKMVPEGIDTPDAPGKVTFVVTGKKAILKGNSGQTVLKQIESDRTKFIEVTGIGNVFLWSILPGTGNIPTYLVSQKAYSLSGPIIFSIAYKCD